MGSPAAAVSGDLARRFLHVNLNCVSIRAAEALYGGVLGLTARMRTDPKVAGEGSMLGLRGPTRTAASFLYDARGARGGCALETIEWMTPPLKHDPSTDPVRPGIRSALFTVPDVAVTATALRHAGLQVSDPVAGLASGAKSVLARDADGAVIEVAETPADAPRSGVEGALFAGIRIASVNAVATTSFLTGIGFAVLQSPTQVRLAPEQLAPGDSGEPSQCVIARLALPEDADQFNVTIVEHPDTATHPLPEGGNSQGLYRCALRVENVDDALNQLPEGIPVQGEPVWCPLPGTKIRGLRIAFLRSPDGVVFEFVERPLNYFATC